MRRAFVLTNPRHMQAVRRVDMPEPGFFKIRLVKGGVWVAARITYSPTLDPETDAPLDRSWHWGAEINGQECSDLAPTPGANVMRIWTYGDRITKDEFDYLLADQEHARLYRPHAPEATPNKAVNLREMNPRDLL